MAPRLWPAQAALAQGARPRPPRRLVGCDGEGRPRRRPRPKRVPRRQARRGHSRPSFARQAY
eukprot:3897938-Alexandrium_andersonii.AAC.1